MLVGEVRWATTGRGSSWKLSGGSQLSSAVTNVSKKRQLRRAAVRMICRSSPVSCSGGRVTIGRLIKRATAGERAQRTANAAATARVSPELDAAITPATSASTRAPDIFTYVRARSSRALDFTCAAVTHSSIRRRVTTSRSKVRPTASAMSQAWCASKVSASAICAAASATVVPMPRR